MTASEYLVHKLPMTFNIFNKKIEIYVRMFVTRLIFHLHKQLLRENVIYLPQL